MEGIPKVRIIPMGIPAVPGCSSPALGASRDEAAADFSPFLVREDPKMPQERSRTPQNNARVSLSPTSSRMGSIQGVRPHRDHPAPGVQLEIQTSPGFKNPSNFLWI